MKEIKIKYIFGLFFIVFHLLIIIQSVYFRFNGGLLVKELTSILGIVTPVLTGYSTIIISFFIKDRYRINYDSHTVTPVFVFVLFLFSFVFFASMMISIYYISRKEGFDNFEEFKNTLLLIESIQSFTLGLVIYSLFPKENIKPTQPVRKAK